MSDPFVAEIRIFGFNFAPTGWAQCDGQLLPISQNTALFSLLGTFYGGDGKSTFALPNLQGSCAVGQGQGQGLSQYFLGQQGGSQFITLIESEIPVHTHNIGAYTDDLADLQDPGPATTIGQAAGLMPFIPPAGNTNANLNFGTFSIAGGSLPHNNMMPYLTNNFCIAMQGVFPPRG
jgi:microcystin-dependent protein